MIGPFYTRDGSSWEPQNPTSTDAITCIGCGCCFKVCSRQVMRLHGVNELGEIFEVSEGVELDDRLNRMVMVVDQPGRFICARVCPKNCHTMSTLQASIIDNTRH
ncbi:ferredoxin III, nif-specific [Rhizobium grahamii]|uniref:Ferredoxin III, nif-specific n=1 Tax=Rhizobium grahamii TaxID=1120045 RepID=A0A370KFQ6_9HYPH|nr:ferredoxin III, nif-specific [Rhizobium grahamii]RDJ01973.1 ferredoxin III, nif-specific [Rhizobium grahamii]